MAITQIRYPIWGDTKLQGLRVPTTITVDWSTWRAETGRPYLGTVEASVDFDTALRVIYLFVVSATVTLPAKVLSYLTLQATVSLADSRSVKIYTVPPAVVEAVVTELASRGEDVNALANDKIFSPV